MERRTETTHQELPEEETFLKPDGRNPPKIKQLFIGSFVELEWQWIVKNPWRIGHILFNTGSITMQRGDSKKVLGGGDHRENERR